MFKMISTLCVWCILVACIRCHPCETDSSIDCCELYVHDGCSVPAWARWWLGDYPVLFRPACQRHDVCYLCGTALAYDKEVCDDLFYDDMVELCDGSYWCWYMANIFYYGVDGYGDSSYRDDIVDECFDGYAVPCLAE